jgi:retron-type reverse transcriptase
VFEEGRVIETEEGTPQGAVISPLLANIYLHHVYDQWVHHWRQHKLRWRIESALNRLKDFKRIATRYDRLARNYLASVCLAAALVWWI